MKPEELMIGDIVTFKDCQNDKKPVIIKIWSINQDGESFAFIDDDESVDEIVIDDEIVGLPLTPEILEKNGFSGKMYTICEIDENRKLQFYYHEHRLKLYWVGVDEYNNSSVVTDEIFRCHCMYVHELQHSLKLCGIEKTIEL